MKKIASMIALAMLALASFSLIPSHANADTSVEQTWARMHGQITQWGANPTFGWIIAHARMVDASSTYREWAKVHAIWTLSPRHINCTEPPTANFTYSFCVARLLNSSVIELDYSGYDFYIAGTWDAYNVTIAYYVNEIGELISYTLSVEPLALNAYGELRVLDNWTKFELSITGIDMLSGTVRMYIVGQMEVEICDMNGNGAVNIEDLVKVAKRYGSMPGLGNYTHEMDFNFDFKIDMGDLTTVAANIEPA